MIFLCFNHFFHNTFFTRELRSPKNTNKKSLLTKKRYPKVSFPSVSLVYLPQEILIQPSYVKYDLKTSVIKMQLSNVIYVSSRWYADSSSTGQFPEDNSPTDTSPMETSLMDISLNGQFPDWAIPRRTLPRLDISPLRHFPERTFPSTCFSEIFFLNHFLFV